MVRLTFPCSFEHVKPMPFDKVLNMQGSTMVMQAMVKNILDFILSQLISSRKERQNISRAGLRAIIANSGLELQSVKNIVNMPLTRQLKAERHSANSISDPKSPKKLSSKLL